MSAEANEQLNLRWIQAFNERNWDEEAACRSEDFLAHMSGAPDPLNRAGWSAFMSAFFAAFPDAWIIVEDSLSSEDTVASRWNLTGTHQGDFQGVPATGRQIAMAGIDFSRVVDGKIAEHWAQFDLLGLMRQIGAMC